MGAGFLVPVDNNRPAHIVALELGQRGTDYVRIALQKLGNLSSTMAQLVNNQGLSFAPIEQGKELKDALHFTTGMNMPTTAVRTWLANYITQHWGDNCQLVFEDAWLLKSDVERQPPDQPCFFVDQTPCYALQAKDVLARLVSGEKEVTSHSFAAFVVTPPVDLPPAGQEATQQQKNLLIQNMRAVLLSSYDREGFVVWQKQR